MLSIAINGNSERSGKKETAKSCPYMSIEELYMIKQVTGRVDTLIIYNSNNNDQIFEKVTEIKTSRETFLSDVIYN